jgi:hypothetical protein
MSIQLTTDIFSLPIGHPGVGIIFDWLGGSPKEAVENYLLLKEHEKIVMMKVFPTEEIDMFAFCVEAVS